jgi:hypothetical protein
VVLETNFIVDEDEGSVDSPFLISLPLHSVFLTVLSVIRNFLALGATLIFGFSFLTLSKKISHKRADLSLLKLGKLMAL